MLGTITVIKSRATASKLNTKTKATFTALGNSGERGEYSKTEFETFLERSLGYYEQKQSDSGFSVDESGSFW